MKVIKPITITSAMLLSSSAPETDFAAWSSATAYTLGAKVIRTSTHRIYQRLVAGTTATAPESDPVNWLDIGPTNRWAMFDGEISTATTKATSLAVTLAPGRASGLALIGLAGSDVTVSIVETETGDTVYTASTTLDAAIIGDWYQYTYSPFRQMTEWVLSDLPPYSTAEITVTITGTTTACGALVLGEVYHLGGTLMGPRLGISDYSRKETDEFGAVSFVRRAYARRLTVDAMFPLAELAPLQRLLSDLRATPAVYIPADGMLYAPMVIYGWYRDFGVTVAYSTHCLCSLELEGLT